MGLGEAAGSSMAAIANLSNFFGRKEMEEFKEAVRLLEAVKDPNFDFSQLTPMQLQYIADLDPATYEAHVPQEFKDIVEDPAMRESQLRALGGWERIAREGLPEEDRLAAQEAQRAVGQAHKRAVESTIRGLAERGRLGGGTELRARLSGAQQAAELARGMGSDLQREAIRNRIAALQQSGQLAGDIRGQDLSKAAQSAQMFNRFNQFISQQMNAARAQNAAAIQAARARNVGEKQRVADVNAQAVTENQRRNQEYINSLKQALADFQLQKAGMVAGARTNLGRARAAEKAGKINALYSLGYSGGETAESIGGMFGGGGGGMF